MRNLKVTALAFACFGLSSLPHYGQTARHESGPYSPYTTSGGAFELEVETGTSIEDQTPGRILATSGADLSNPGGDALTVRYINGRTLHYLSTVAETGTINGNIAITVENGIFNDQTSSPAITEAVIGTAYGASDVEILGDVNVTIRNGEFHGNVFAGGGATVKGDTSLVIEGGVFVSGRGVFGGNSWGGVTEGGTSLTISGGDFSQADVYGGNYRTDASFDRNVIQGEAIVTISGGTFASISGGSFNADTTKTGSKAGQVVGGTLVVIDTSGSNTVTINGDINAASGLVDGNAGVTFTGDGSQLVFTGNINAHSATDSAAGELKGDAGVIFEGFTGNFNGSIQNGFDLLAVGDASDVVFANSFSVQTLVISDDSVVSLEDGTDFAKLSIYFGSGSFSGDEEFAFDLSNLFASGAPVLDDGVQFTVFDALGGEWYASYDDGNISVISQIPEPSTYALIGGAAALLLFRRRGRILA